MDTQLRWFKIYAGVGGSFGGAKYIGTYQYQSEEEAGQAAYEEAWNAYESYSSRIRVRSVETIMEEDGLDEEAAQEARREEVEPWLSYHVEETDGPG